MCVFVRETDRQTDRAKYCLPLSGLVSHQDGIVLLFGRSVFCYLFLAACLSACLLYCPRLSTSTYVYSPLNHVSLSALLSVPLSLSLTLFLLLSTALLSSVCLHTHTHTHTHRHTYTHNTHCRSNSLLTYSMLFCQSHSICLGSHYCFFVRLYSLSPNREFVTDFG